MEKRFVVLNFLKYCIYISLIVAIIVIVQSCGRSSDKLQGKWSASGDLADSTDLRSWFVTYEFEGRNYKMSGYPPISEEGTYEIIQENGDSLLVYYNVSKSSPEAKSHKDWIILKDSTMMLGQLNLRKSQQH